MIGRSRGSAAHQSRNSSRKTVRAQARSGSGIGPDATSLRVADILAALKRLDPSRYSFTADVGDSWFIALELRTEIFLAAGYYASMGFAVPGAGSGNRRARAAAVRDCGRWRLSDDRNRAGDHGRTGAGAHRAAAEQQQLWNARGDRPATQLLRPPKLGLCGHGPHAGCVGRTRDDPGRAGRGHGPCRSRPGRFPHRGGHCSGRPLAGHGSHPRHLHTPPKPRSL